MMEMTFLMMDASNANFNAMKVVQFVMKEAASNAKLATYQKGLSVSLFVEMANWRLEWKNVTMQILKMEMDVLRSVEQMKDGLVLLVNSHAKFPLHH